VTERIAAVNLDWDQIKAVDIFMMLQSFTPSTGSVVSVTIYPSEFGLQRMAQEEKSGPVGIWKEKDEEVCPPCILNLFHVIYFVSFLNLKFVCAG
jgi:hypothetical protein